MKKYSISLNSLLMVMTLLSLLFTSCNDKGEEPSKKIQNENTSDLLEGLFIELDAENDFQISTIDNNQSYELGYEFSSTKRDLVTHLGHNLPEAGKYIVTLWDITTEQPLAQAEVEQTNSNGDLNNWVYVELDYPVAIVNDITHYRISVYLEGGTSYHRVKNDVLDFPNEQLELENFIIYKDAYKLNNSGYPFSTGKNTLSGIPTFKMTDGLMHNSLSMHLIDNLPLDELDVKLYSAQGKNYNEGYEFSVKSDGKITHLGHNLYGKGVGTVTLWDKESKVILAQANVEKIGDKNGVSSWTYKKLDNPITIEKDKHYVMTVFNNGSDLYLTSIGKLPLPLTYEEVTIYQGLYIDNELAFPNKISNNYISGMPDFIFEK